MSDAPLSPEDAQLLIDYARRRFRDEQWPLSPSLAPVRELLEKLKPQPVPPPPPSRARPYEPSMHARKQKRRR